MATLTHGPALTAVAPESFGRRRFQQTKHDIVELGVGLTILAQELNTQCTEELDGKPRRTGDTQTIQTNVRVEEK